MSAKLINTLVTEPWNALDRVLDAEDPMESIFFGADKERIKAILMKTLEVHHFERYFEYFLFVQHIRIRYKCISIHTPVKFTWEELKWDSRVKDIAIGLALFLLPDIRHLFDTGASTNVIQVCTSAFYLTVSNEERYRMWSKWHKAVIQWKPKEDIPIPFSPSSKVDCLSVFEFDMEEEEDDNQYGSFVDLEEEQKN